MNLQVANFEDLLQTYYHGTSAHTAATHLRNLIVHGPHLQLENLLRDFRQRAIVSDHEIKLRAATDRLMTCYSIMEIASLIGFIADIHRTEFGAEAIIVLEDKQVRQYYEEFYPTKLPRLFRFRLTGKSYGLSRAANPVTGGNFIAFLDLDRRFMENLEDRYLLRMLDSFTIDGYWFSDVVELIGTPEAFIDHLLRSSEDRDARSCALFEFSIFMQFCFDLKELLERFGSQPLLQSAMWNHYGYWFDIVGKQLNEQLGAALARFLQWEPRSGRKEVVDEVRTYVSEAQTALKLLTSRAYSSPVDTVLKTMEDKA
ncbi:MAG: hypothetical protein JWM68_3586 [Verrucomicrobiales bacterium]|nr:hypothetical protein [Verrucomicrobiales bacterium]